MLIPQAKLTKEKVRKLNALVGNPYSLWTRPTMKGIGSQRLLIKKANQEVWDLFTNDNHQKFTNIELRPKGIILWFRVKLDTYLLIIPYHKLTIYKQGNHLRLFVDHWKIILTPTQNNSFDNTFMDKMMRQRVIGLSDYRLD
ncbi:MAG: hypothetical protein OCD76_04210 [Reichenbachiella sp.]